MEMIIYICLLVVIAIALLLKLFFKIKVYHSFKLDKVIQKETDEYQTTLLYKVGKFADPITETYISRYTIVTQNKQKSLVVKYNEPLKMIRYNVYLYGASSKLIEVLEVEERNTNEISRDIMLSKKCKKINIEVVAINDELVNRQLNKVSLVKIFTYSALSFAFVSLSLFGLIYIVIGTEAANDHLLEIISAGLIYFVLLFINLIKKNGKDVDANGTN